MDKLLRKKDIAIPKEAKENKVSFAIGTIPGLALGGAYIGYLAAGTGAAIGIEYLEMFYEIGRYLFSCPRSGGGSGKGSSSSSSFGGYNASAGVNFGAMFI